MLVAGSVIAGLFGELQARTLLRGAPTACTTSELMDSASPPPRRPPLSPRCPTGQQGQHCIEGLHLGHQASEDLQTHGSIASLGHLHLLLAIILGSKAVTSAFSSTAVGAPCQTWHLSWNSPHCAVPAWAGTGMRTRTRTRTPACGC